MKIITLSGLDGSGKSTQIEMLKNYLKSKGKSFIISTQWNFRLRIRIVKSKKSKIWKRHKSKLVANSIAQNCAFD